MLSTMFNKFCLCSVAISMAHRRKVINGHFSQNKDLHIPGCCIPFISVANYTEMTFNQYVDVAITICNTI